MPTPSPSARLLSPCLPALVPLSHLCSCGIVSLLQVSEGFHVINVMGEKEDGMVPRPSTSTSLMTSENTFGPPNDYHHNYGSNMSYPLPPSNPDNLRPVFRSVESMKKMLIVHFLQLLMV
ncbi:hypothetical protein I3760_07G032300 [Carya illinoinensis]|nr:hypothetical protein I3760_07G032300 [Carya illinoinensis]